MKEGLNNLEANGNDVDFIVSHCCSSGTQALFGGGLFIPDVLTDYLEQIRQIITYMSDEELERSIKLTIDRYS